ncbi:DNA-binding protein [Tenacibaculum maritimum]|uniref:S1 motif domain-containing protein n=1 Tax=Tenacibaculum maritimum NCIMB 2154 TaxID=1349785 RepID=A0A2H1EBF4_9FLAO|nr:DNA-binding protein [Tenacibaculum maritimum]MCD9563218.1 DNA-binding protein [Tenacibaculum maritimum]MCD9566530.1 DNA-binding protein [Tenacibaculum maritimum]MCD9579856.1 DNA-binding protein [Tenacibaculum maritimum]MCD9585599.1 DNA-binding protein [Tenacibaculum maritimum]MCD9597388.1 DNA-binding protein [Tenacibaculum maritimum]
MEYLNEGDKVDLIIGQKTMLGYTVLINEEFEGLLYKNEIFSEVEEGMKMKGYVKKVREDEKIDVSLRPQGFKSVIDTDVEVVLNKLKEKGFLLLTDKSSPESIKFHLQMSKKAFKRAIGNLYKNKKIVISSDRISLT